uniref:Uncharacterized protein n=1 Tax=Pithovirus LCPAC403 TaxID=2506596 RepID=A0A481ZC41_9VIRU|nr:MAG: hypothetical protein LCPAC403_03600 [Pithovirus LCPAC403]
MIAEIAEIKVVVEIEVAKVQTVLEDRVDLEDLEDAMVLMARKESMEDMAKTHAVSYEKFANQDVLN